MEHPFGTIKRQWGFDYILTKKGMQRASADVGLIFIAYNFRRLITIMGKNRLMEYLRATLASFLAFWANKESERREIHQQSGHGKTKSMFGKMDGFLKDFALKWRNSWRLDLNHEEFIKMCEKSPMLFNPGDKMKYCNTNYYLLGMLIEKLSGKRYSEYLVNHIFEPLEMSNSRLDNAKAIIANRVSGYTLEDGELKNAEFTSDTWAYSEGGIVTTIEDLAKLESSLYTEKLIQRKNLELMWTPAKLNDGSNGILGDNGAGKPNYYGLGWAISDYKNHKLILAGGNFSNELHFSIEKLKFYQNFIIFNSVILGLKTVS